MRSIVNVTISYIKVLDMDLWIILPCEMDSKAYIANVAYNNTSLVWILHWQNKQIVRHRSNSKGWKLVEKMKRWIINWIYLCYTVPCCRKGWASAWTTLFCWSSGMYCDMIAMISESMYDYKKKIEIKGN